MGGVRPARGASAGALALAVTLALAGCSFDTILWGAGGARVIETSDQLLAAVAAGDPEPLVCDGADPELGTASDWVGLSPGEPERYHPPYWPDQAPLDPDWNINLELGTSVTDGRRYPSYVFYRETDDRLCVVDIAWGTVWIGD